MLVFKEYLNSSKNIGLSACQYFDIFWKGYWKKVKLCINENWGYVLFKKMTQIFEIKRSFFSRNKKICYEYKI